MRGVPTTGLRPGVRVGVDVGSVRVGVAASDAAGAVVLPVATLARGTGTVAELAALVRERAAVEVVVGLPLGLSGREGPAAALVRAFAVELAAAVAGVPVRLVDERFSTTAATRELQPERGRPTRRSRGSRGTGSGGRGSGGSGSGGRGSGGRGSGRSGERHVDSRALRSVIDQQAAAIILRTALQTEDATGAPPGEPVTGGAT